MQVLIAEDDAISRRVLEATLAKWGYDALVTSDGEEAWGRLKARNAPKLAILDWMMPGMDGLDVCRRIRQKDDGGTYTYVILLTTKGQKEDVIAGMDAGADDYITKPFDSGELHVRLRAARRVLDLESQLLAAQEALQDEALHDSLTGLWNRTAIIDILQKELSRSVRDGACVGVILADIDHFKRINDTFGHKAGDTVLRHATGIMQTSLRDYDSIGRYGGEEFLIVMPGCDLEAAAARAEAIRAELAGSQIPLERGKVSLSICMGVTTSSEHVVPDIDTLIQAADMAMYRAKKAGRNRVKTAARTVGEPS
jgi:two-component system cell cycle response regulator